MKFTFLRTLTAVVFTCVSLTAMASGSDGGGGAETGDAQAYNSGKLVYAQKLACNSCAMAGKTLDAATAKHLLTDKPVAGLTDDEARALSVYLTRRFKL
jgi:hypothetical protein